MGASLTGALGNGANTGADLAEALQTYQTYERWLAEARRESATSQQTIAFATQGSAECEAKELRQVEDQQRLERRRQIFTVDVELDEVLTAFKLTFMNRCSVRMKDCLDIRMEIQGCRPKLIVASMLQAPLSPKPSVRIDARQSFTFRHHREDYLELRSCHQLEPAAL